MNKTFNFDGRDLFVFGRPGDPYFDHLNIGDHTNDFLLYVSKNFLSDDATIFDIGANIGVTAAILATAAPRDSARQDFRGGWLSLQCAVWVSQSHGI